MKDAVCSICHDALILLIMKQGVDQISMFETIQEMEIEIKDSCEKS